MEATSLFLQRAPLNALFVQLTSAPFDTTAQEFFFNTAIAPYQEKYPPPLRYLKAFLKQVMKIIEDQNLEVIDELTELAVETSIKDYSSSNETEGEGYFIFQMNYPVSDNTMNVSEQVPFLNDSNTQSYQRRQSDSNIDTDIVVLRRNTNHNQVGLKLWKAGLLMGDFCINMSHLFRGRSVLELGSGTGVTGITLADVCRPSKIFLTDFHDEVLQNLEFNVAINIDIDKDKDIDNSLSGVDVTVSFLDWGVYSEKNIIALDSDIIIAADCTYSSDLCVLVLQTISSFLRYENPLFSTLDASARYTAWQTSAMTIDNTTPSILFRSKKMCLLCFTIRAPETLEFFYDTLQSLSHEIAYEDVTEWVLQSCVASSFYYEGGRDDLRVLCIVPSVSLLEV